MNVFFLFLREQAKANRGGTRGFRAPEVLLRVKHQTVGKILII